MLNIDKPKVYNCKIHNDIENAVNVMRPSIFGNPFVIGRDGTRDEVCEKFERYMLENKSLLKEVKALLKGKNLICCCAPKRCHGDTLLRIANDE